MRVAVEPLHAEDMPQLEAALKLLNQADPFVEVSVQESGEHVLGAAGVPLEFAAPLASSRRLSVAARLSRLTSTRSSARHAAFAAHKCSAHHMHAVSVSRPAALGQATFCTLMRPDSILKSALTAGEVHLETCVKDLRERFARIPLHVSAPLVAFRESVFHPAELTAELLIKPGKVR